MQEPTSNSAHESVVEQDTAPGLGITPSNAIIMVLLVVILILGGFIIAGGDGDNPAMASAVANEATAPMAMPAPAAQDTADAPVAPTPSPDALSNAVQIKRRGEGRLFYRTITIPPGSETLYLSGSGASQKADGTWGNMEEQAIDTFTRFKTTLEEEGWSMADIVQVRAFAVAGEYGLLDFDGFNRGYSRFFGTQDNPNKPVRSFVQVADLVVDGWLVEVEIRAARVP